MQEDEDQTEYEDEYPIASEAIVRIEKAKLYQLLLQNDLFGEDAGDWQAVEQVTAEIKAFVLGQLETLIGMRSGNEAVMAPARLPWNTNQVQALTELADRLLNMGNKPVVPTPPKPSVNTINRPVQPPKQATPAPKPVAPRPTAPQKRPQPRPAGAKPIIGNAKASQTPTQPPMAVKAGDERAYAKPIDNPLRKPMPSAAEFQAHAFSQVTSGLDFVSQGTGTPEDSQAVGKLLLRGMTASIESVQQGVD